MRTSFEKDKSILASDYKYFATQDALATPHEFIPRSKAAHTSVERSERQSRE